MGTHGQLDEFYGDQITIPYTWHYRKDLGISAYALVPSRPRGAKIPRRLAELSPSKNTAHLLKNETQSQDDVTQTSGSTKPSDKLEVAIHPDTEHEGEIDYGGRGLIRLNIEGIFPDEAEKTGQAPEALRQFWRRYHKLVEARRIIRGITNPQKGQVNEEKKPFNKSGCLLLYSKMPFWPKECGRFGGGSGSIGVGGYVVMGDQSWCVGAGVEVGPWGVVRGGRLLVVGFATTSASVDKTRSEGKWAATWKSMSIDLVIKSHTDEKGMFLGLLDRTGRHHSRVRQSKAVIPTSSRARERVQKSFNWEA
ncbi:hypothetical protein Tco_0929971 [Tanacetum coccineum]